MRARIAVVALAVVATGCFDQDLPVVETAGVEAADVTETVSAPASVDAKATQDVAAGVSGVVVALRVADGEKVRKGDVVLRLASDQVDLARQQADAAEAAAAGMGGIAVDGNGDQTLAATWAAVERLDERTRPRIRRARRRAQRIDDADQRAAALAAVAAVEASYQSTRAALLTAGQTLASTQDATASSLSRALNQAVASAAAAQLAQASAAAAAAQAQAGELKVRAPFRGVLQYGTASASDGGGLPAGLGGQAGADLGGALGALGGGDGGGTLRVGAPVTAGQTLFSVYDLSELYVDADVDEIDAPDIRVGQRATVLIDAFPDAEYEGIVERVQVAAETTAAGGVGYPVRIRLLDPPAGARVGMTSSAEITTRTVSSDLVVPSRALLREDDTDVVYVVRDGVVRIVPVDVEALGEETAAVRGDLTDDDEVIVAGYEEVDDGDRVDVR